MRNITLLTLFCLYGLFASAQVQTQIIGDSVRIHSNTGTAELNLENSTDTVPGFLFNTGIGRTQFRHGLVKLTDSSYLVGADTLIIRPSSSASTLAAVLTQGNKAIPGTATNPPIYMVPGTLMTTPTTGALEYDGVGFYITDSTGARHDLTQTDRIFKIYSLDYESTFTTDTMELPGWNAVYVNSGNPADERTVVSTMDIEITLPSGTPSGTVISVNFEGAIIYKLTVTANLPNDSYVIGSLHINQDLKYPNMYYIRGAAESIDATGTVTSTNTAYRLYPLSFVNPQLIFTWTAGANADPTFYGRIGATYTVDKKQQGRFIY